jgi:hypothetical protein
MIEIHVDGKPVTKLEAARALAEVMGRSVTIGEPNAEGWINGTYITVYARTPRYGRIDPPEVSWPSTGSQGAEGTREFAGMLLLGAELAELAMMLAAEQDAAGRTVDLSKCLGKYDRLGNTDWCQRDEGHDGQHAGHMGRRWNAGPA